MIVDTSKDGLEMLFYPWQVKIIESIFNDDIERTSRQVWNEVNQKIAPETISRASVINFLNDATEKKVLQRREELGKGGKHGLYTRNLTIPNLWNNVLNEVFEKVQKARLVASLHDGLITEEEYKNTLKQLKIKE